MSLLRVAVLAIIVGVALGLLNLNKWKREVLNLHNQLRQSVAIGNETNDQGTTPTAAYMAKLKWDKNLEKKAQKYAKSCKWRDVRKRGENIGMFRRGNDASHQDIVQMWFDEDFTAKINYSKMDDVVVQNDMLSYTQASISYSRQAPITNYLADLGQN